MKAYEEAMKTYEEEKKRLKERLEALSTDYFFTVNGNDGKEIKETFQKYFDLVKDEPVIDKAIIGYACNIFMIYNRNIRFIDDDVENSALEMAAYLSERMAFWGKDYVAEILHDDKFPSYWDDVDELQELIQQHYKNK